MKQFFLLGLGKSNRAVASFLSRKGHKVWGWDDREEIRNVYQASIIFEQPRWSDQWILVASPGITPQHPLLHQAQQQGTEILCDIALFFRFFPEIKALGVTGTNGKSTTCCLIKHFFDTKQIPCSLLGNIGRPIFEDANEETTENFLSNQWYVIEMSSYQLEFCPKGSLPLKGAGILNLSPHHLERHGNMSAYLSAKKRIFEEAQQKILSIDEPLLFDLAQQNPAAYCKISGTAERWSQADIFYNAKGLYGEDFFLSWGDSLFAEKPFLRQNAALAYGLLKNNIDMTEDWNQSLESFSPPKHRQQFLGKKENVHYINDSKATNPEAALQALLSCTTPVYWLMGGVLQQDALEVLNKGLRKVAHGFAYGQSGPRFQAFLREKGVSCTLCNTLEEALNAAEAESHKNAKPSTILLSPACPSFDQFRDFVHRGEYFTQLVHQVSGSSLCL